MCQIKIILIASQNKHATYSKIVKSKYLFIAFDIAKYKDKKEIKLSITKWLLRSFKNMTNEIDKH